MEKAEELLILYASPNIIWVMKSRRMRWAGRVEHMGKKRNAYRLLIGETEGKRPLGRPSHRREDNIRMDLRGVRWKGMDWIHLTQDRDQWRSPVNTVMKLRVP
jgi:hypothetical protein